jgi:hypothetical protein
VLRFSSLPWRFGNSFEVRKISLELWELRVEVLNVSLEVWK